MTYTLRCSSWRLIAVLKTYALFLWENLRPLGFLEALLALCAVVGLLSSLQLDVDLPQMGLLSSLQQPKPGEDKWHWFEPVIGRGGLGRGGLGLVLTLDVGVDEMVWLTTTLFCGDFGGAIFCSFSS
ncbi:hypothetical protein Ancab_017590 [Ancistrocladus abbreviatus]